MIEKEIRLWLSGPPMSERVDILDYWKSREATLPLLSMVARQYCSIPVTSTSLSKYDDYDFASFRILQNTENEELLVYLHGNCRELLQHVED
jgi:hypothetical protein